jgi:nitroimidazol reductase NimA-like FMN-containing flavoprotein (pyridoxamine 5'-phosphate oxidase superfamily)
VSGKDIQKMMSAVSLSKEEIEIFLSPPRIARLSTVKDDGRPHVVPVWFYSDGTHILVPTMTGSIKAKNIQKNPYVSIVIDVVECKSEDISYLNTKAVIVEGKAEVKMIIVAHLPRRCMKGIRVRILFLILWFNTV